VACSRCQTRYPRATGGVPDLRLQAARRVRIAFDVGTAPPSVEGLDLTPLQRCPAPQVDFRGCPLPYHMSEELRSYLPAPRGPGSLALDLGCGDAIHREMLRYAGFEYLGMDVDPGGATVLGDAHALPLKARSMELVLSVAVLEHLRFPAVAMREVRRVLEPGGWFIGTVAFLEPFHQESYYHHTHLGLLSTLQHGGLEVHRLAPSRSWNVFAAQARMAPRPPGMPAALARWSNAVPSAVSDGWFRVARAAGRGQGEAHWLRSVTGAFSYVARRPTTPP